VSKKKPVLSRVTSVLSSVNAEWYKYWVKKYGVEECERITRESQIFGREVHKIVENHMNGVQQTFSHTPEYKCAGDIIGWLSEKQVKPLYIEAEFIDKKLGLIGHADLIGEIDGKNYVIDFKTGSAMKKEMPLQLAAYGYMAENQYKMKIDSGIILRAPRDVEKGGEFEVMEYTDLRKKYFPVFKQALALYQYFNGKGKWRK
jgi:CRISPR/Cas system-associated exonuclease Cas4 (RecB family)